MMNSIRKLPKIPFKSLACENIKLKCQQDQKRSILTAIRLPPEVPLTKPCNEDVMRYSKAPPKIAYPLCAPEHQQKTKTKTKKQKLALNGLSNWYSNHLVAMNAIQKYKKFRQEHDGATENYYDKLANFNYSKSLKYKRQAAGPHMDLENYLNSLKSRQKELSTFRRESKVWERYFERAIPGWTEIKQRNKIDSKHIEKALEKVLASDVEVVGEPNANDKRKPRLQLAHNEEKTNNDNNKKQISMDSNMLFNAEILFKRQSSMEQSRSAAARQSDGVKFTNEISGFELITEPKQSCITAAYSTSNTIEDQARRFFQKIPEAKSERKGHVNNEIIFDEIYGKYFAKNQLNSDDKMKKQRAKIPNVLTADLLKKYRQGKIKDPEVIKFIENMLRLRREKFQAKSEKEKEKKKKQQREAALGEACVDNTASLIEVTNDPRVFAAKNRACKLSKRAPTQVLLVGNKMAPLQKKSSMSCAKVKAASISQKDINNRKILVVEGSNGKCNNTKANTNTNANTNANTTKVRKYKPPPQPAQPYKPNSPSSFLSYARSHWKFNS